MIKLQKLLNMKKTLKTKPIFWIGWAKMKLNWARSCKELWIRYNRWEFIWKTAVKISICKHFQSSQMISKHGPNRCFNKFAIVFKFYPKRIPPPQPTLININLPKNLTKPLTLQLKMAMNLIMKSGGN